jgi:hypothetical protein
MHPHLQANGLAILVSAIVSFALGSLWYGPLFGRVWQRAMGFATKPARAEIARGSAINLIATFFIALGLTHNVLIWRPSTWQAGPDEAPWTYAVFAGLQVWLFFIIPMLLNGVAFERKPWRVFFLNAAFHLLSVMTMAMILSYWH